MNKEQQELFHKITLNQDCDVQKKFIIMGIEKGLNVSTYANPEIDLITMKKMGLKLERNK